jgi:hypothetical protein
MTWGRIVDWRTGRDIGAATREQWRRWAEDCAALYFRGYRMPAGRTRDGLPGLTADQGLVLEGGPCVPGRIEIERAWQDAKYAGDMLLARVHGAALDRDGEEAWMRAVRQILDDTEREAGVLSEPAWQVLLCDLAPGSDHSGSCGAWTVREGLRREVAEWLALVWSRRGRHAVAGPAGELRRGGQGVLEFADGRLVLESDEWGEMT